MGQTILGPRRRDPAPPPAPAPDPVRHAALERFAADIAAELAEPGAITRAEVQACLDRLARGTLSTTAPAAPPTAPA